MFACGTAPLLARRANGENNTHTKQMKTTLANTIANTLLVITMIAVVSLIFAATQI
jgi:hypothetical protein